MEAAAPPADPEIRDPQSQLSFAVGGRTPTSARLSVEGGGYDVEQEFEKEQVVTITEKVVIREVAFRDIVDPKTKAVVGSRRKHIAERVEYKIVSVEDPEDGV